MRKLPSVHIDGYKEMSISSLAIEYLKPKAVFIPIEFPSPLKLKVEVGSHILKGEEILFDDGRFYRSILSPVSGTIKEVVRKWHPQNKMMNMLEIENDFKETLVDTFKNLDPEKMKREELIDCMKKAGLVGMGGAGFPTYIKYQTDKKVDMVIINLAECEPFITCDYTNVLYNPSLLIYGLKYLMKAAGTDKAYIALKDKAINKPLINSLLPILEEGMSLYFLKDVYPAGWERYIVEKVTKKTYKILPIEAGAIVSNATTCISFANTLKNGIPPLEKYVTITGDAIKKPGNVLVKFGTPILELLPLFGGLKENLAKEDCIMVSGGPLTGSSMYSDDFIVTPTLGSVIVLEDKYNKNPHPSCLGCGMCAKKCPCYLSPFEIRRTLKTGDIEELKNLGVLKCIQCGMCSYVCPSRIDLTESVINAKNLVRKLGAK